MNYSKMNVNFLEVFALLSNFLFPFRMHRVWRLRLILFLINAGLSWDNGAGLGLQDWYTGPAPGRAKQRNNTHT